MKFRPIIIILFIYFFGSIQVNAAVKWNNSSSSSQNNALIDVDSLEQKEVPKGFPHYEIRVTEICKVKGKYKTDSRLLYYSEGFLWGAVYYKDHARIYEGNSSNGRPFKIMVSEAHKYSSNSSTWQKYEFPERVNVLDALEAGVKGSGSWNRKCSIEAIGAQFKKLDTPKKKKNALDSMKSLQKRVLTIYRAGGFLRKYAYKFHPESIKLANTRSNHNDVLGIVWADLGNTMVCHIANQTPNNHWTKEKIGIGLREAKKRGLDCVRNNNGVETLIVEAVEAPVNKAVQPEKQRKAEEEQRRLAELEKQRKAEEEQRRLAELEKQRKAEEEQRRLAELEKQRKAEEEQRRLAELEKQRKAEEEQRRLAELEKQRKAEEEQRRLAELEKQRKAEEEQRRLAELEKQRKLKSAVWLS